MDFVALRSKWPWHATRRVAWEAVTIAPEKSSTDREKLVIVGHQHVESRRTSAIRPRLMGRSLARVGHRSPSTGQRTQRRP